MHPRTQALSKALTARGVTHTVNESSDPQLEDDEVALAHGVYVQVAIGGSASYCYGVNQSLPDGKIRIFGAFGLGRAMDKALDVVRLIDAQK